MKSLLKKLIPENLHPLRYVNERTLAHFNGISRNDQIDQSQTREAPRRKRTAVAHSGRKAQIKLIDQPFRLLRSFSLLLRKKFQFTMVALRLPPPKHRAEGLFYQKLTRTATRKYTPPPLGLGTKKLGKVHTP